MTTVRLGKTEITVNKNGFGALPIQRITKSEAVYLLHKAFDGGITAASTSTILPELIQTAKRNWARLLTAGATASGSRPKPALRPRKISGKIWRSPFAT